MCYLDGYRKWSLYTFKNKKTGKDADKLNEESDKSYDVMIEGITTGTVVDYGIKDSMNMGAAMAPAACVRS